jgi:hypothetical protein
MDQEWCEDLASATLDQILRLERENRAWKKELKTKAGSLVNDRLAKRIEADQYATGRKAAAEASAECSRRERILGAEIANRRCLLRADKTNSKEKPPAPGRGSLVPGALEASLDVQASRSIDKRGFGDSSDRLRQPAAAASSGSKGNPATE